MDGIQDLGQRIVQAARLAVAVHLYESVACCTEPHDAGPGSHEVKQILRRRIEIGGAGPNLTAGEGDEGDTRQAAQQPPSPRLGYLVTDDERAGLIGLEAKRDSSPDGDDTPDR